MKVAANPYEFPKTFLDERACLMFLERSRWGDGPVISPFTRGPAYRISTRPGIYKCKDTRQTFSVRHGTVFEGTRLPLKKWFYAIHLLGLAPLGMSSIQLALHLGVTQKTAWFMLERLRFAVQHEAFQKDLERPAQTTGPAEGENRAGDGSGRAPAAAKKALATKDRVGHSPSLGRGQRARPSASGTITTHNHPA